MDYEKKYNDALERARKAKEHAELTDKETYIIDSIFPELKESEDERIKRDILEALRYGLMCEESTLMPGVTTTLKEAIDYLEKQKELTKEAVIKQLEKEFYACGTTPKWFHHTIQGAINHARADALGKFNNAPTVVSDELRRQERENAISQLEHLSDVYIDDEKQKEQKPAINIEHLKSYMLQYLQDASNRKDDSEIEADTDKWARMIIKIFEGIEHKPAEWSEEDETCLEYALSCVMKTRRFVAKDACDLDACRCAERWLKSLPERFNLPPKQEWSEEDENWSKYLLDELYAGLEDYCGAAEEDMKKAIKWFEARLKSPRLQPKQEWSEEDKKMLNNTLDSLKRYQLSMPNFHVELQMRWLKSLRPQPKQDVFPSLSEKQIICLKRALDYLRKEHNRYGGEDFTNEIAVLEWLITHPILVSGTHWKPSEEQMNALKHCVNGWQDIADGTLESLYNDLKKYNNEIH